MKYLKTILIIIICKLSLWGQQEDSSKCKINYDLLKFPVSSIKINHNLGDTFDLNLSKINYLYNTNTYIKKEFEFVRKAYKKELKEKKIIAGHLELRGKGVYRVKKNYIDTPFFISNNESNLSFEAKGNSIIIENNFLPIKDKSKWKNYSSFILVFIKDNHWVLSSSSDSILLVVHNSFLKNNEKLDVLENVLVNRNLKREKEYRVTKYKNLVKPIFLNSNSGIMLTPIYQPVYIYEDSTYSNLQKLNVPLRGILPLDIVIEDTLMLLKCRQLRNYDKKESSWSPNSSFIVIDIDSDFQLDKIDCFFDNRPIIEKQNKREIAKLKERKVKRKNKSFSITKVAPKNSINNYSNPKNSNSAYRKTSAIQCTGRTEAGRRCRNKTTNNSGRCHYHN